MDFYKIIHFFFEISPFAVFLKKMAKSSKKSLQLKYKFDIIVKPMRYRKAEICEVADTHEGVVV